MKGQSLDVTSFYDVLLQWYAMLSPPLNRQLTTLAPGMLSTRERRANHSKLYTRLLLPVGMLEVRSDRSFRVSPGNALEDQGSAYVPFTD